ncbi:MAG: histidine phosphatase family protein [Bacteroidetes bacterium]|jgi:2,3-bisphosphoglycerate-dependent phosphoglycerate mutase|nr:histidine phosphatase family protein [Bacteroidota bacterium]
MLYLLRHAESAPSPDIREPDWPLSDRGRRQARVIVPTLKCCGINAIYSSPYRRARETVAPFAEATGHDVTVHDGLRERLLTARFLDDVATPARRTWADFSWSMPDGESNQVAQRRFLATVSTILGRHAGETVLISTHGTVTALLLNAIDSGVGVAEWNALEMPDLIRIHQVDECGSSKVAGADGSLRWHRVNLPAS